MKLRRIAIAGLTGVTLAAAAGGAIAASNDPETQVLEKAAKALDVSPQKLREALADAREDVYGERPFGPHGDRPRLPGHGPVLLGPGRDILAAVPEALGITPRELFDRLRDGQSLEEIAEAEGRTLADLEAAVRRAAEPELDEAVKDGHLTREQADAMLDRIVEGVEHLGRRPPLGPGPRFHHRFPGHP